MTSPLAGRTALVTGAGRGIGRATAIGLAGAGARVAVLARTFDELNETAARVRELRQTAQVVKADLSDPEGVERSLKQVRDEFGTVDVVVNNAAVVWPLGPSVNVDPGQWAAALRLNVTAVATLTFALLPGMLERKWGRVVNVSSGIAAHPGSMLGMNAYATSKAALEAHTLNLAAELAGSGVTVNAFRPGAVDTAMQTWIRGRNPDEIGPDLHDRFQRLLSRRRPDHPRGVGPGVAQPPGQ